MKCSFLVPFLVLSVGLSLGYVPRSATGRTQNQKAAIVTHHAAGAFDVKLVPQTDESDTGFGRVTIDKQYHGDLEATSRGQMLTAGTAAKGSSGGYVALEKVSGRLRGLSGTFILQHSGTMTRGAPQLSITVVPDSGTGELIGLTGSMAIKIADGKHTYEFDYTLEAVQ